MPEPKRQRTLRSDEHEIIIIDCVQMLQKVLLWEQVQFQWRVSVSFILETHQHARSQVHIDKETIVLSLHTSHYSPIYTFCEV
mgnify:FL=1